MSGYLREEAEPLQKAPEAERLPRQASYLLPRLVETQEPSCSEASYLQAFVYALNGRWLRASIDTQECANFEGLKQAVFDQNANIAIVAALLLTVIFPLFLDNIGDYTGDVGNAEAFSYSASNSALGSSWARTGLQSMPLKSWISIAYAMLLLQLVAGCHV
eukprot:TRINITY_DN58311_c0_g1_i1.p1 TRINITY_DN58311_c0_g1~~TRINITY_DN58311_c0_g1_i1.p1  ORF type:complete len:161 (-),score=19.12 TRINITY_DN58311_c0_g1_i1:33-515(-)